VALPSVADAKSVLRIEDASEDALLGQFLARAQAVIETLIGYPLTAASLAFTDYARTDQWDRPTVLQLPGPYKTALPTPTIVDVNGTAVDAATYYLDNRSGKIRAKSGYDFPSGPYTVTSDVGLSAHPDYAARLEAVASQAIVDLAAHLYSNRNPATTQETDEGGSSKTLPADAVPMRVLESVNLLPMAGGIALA
jgi:uncharacterized phiE125 gp8 family phage protein